MAWIGAVISAAAAMTAGIVQNRRNKNSANLQWTRNKQDRSFQIIYDQALWNQQNKKNQELWNQQNQYNESRVDKENAYSRETWALENKYNSPQSQMARYSEAGLNPHLIYGQGTPGNAGSLASGSMRAQQADSNGMSSPDAKGYTRAEATTISMGENAFRDQFEFKQLQAQTNNVEAQTDIARQEAINKAIDGEQKTIDLNRTGETSPYQVEQARLNVENQREILKKHSAEAHVSQSTQQDRIKEIALKVKTAAEKLKGTKLDNAMKGYLDMLKEVGLDNSNALFKSIYLYLKRNGTKGFSWKSKIPYQ